MISRSNRAEVRNPILALPAAKAILQLTAGVRRPLARLFREYAAQAREQAEKCWLTGKPPMAAYWRASATVAKHIAAALNRDAPAGKTEGEILAEIVRERLCGAGTRESEQRITALCREANDRFAYETIAEAA